YWRERSPGNRRDSTRGCAAVMPFQALAAAATLLTMAPHGSRIELQLDRGSAELLWASSGTFRFRRVLEGTLPKIEWTDRDPVQVETQELVASTSNTASSVRLRTKAIEVTIQKKGLLVSVRRLDGVPLMQDLSEPRSEAA